MAKAYDALEKLDPSPENWLGKRAAVSGQFGLLVKSKCTGLVYFRYYYMGLILEKRLKKNEKRVKVLIILFGTSCALNYSQMEEVCE